MSGGNVMAQGSSQVSSGLFSTVFGLLWAYWRSSITLFLLSIIFFNALWISCEQKDFSVFFETIGETIVVSDVGLYNKTDELIQEGCLYCGVINAQGLFATLLAIGHLITVICSIIFPLWTLYIIWYMIYWCFSQFNDSAKFEHLVVATIIIILLDIIANQWAVKPCDITLSQSEYITRLIPFSGVWHFITNIPFLLKPAADISTTIMSA